MASRFEKLFFRIFIILFLIYILAPLIVVMILSFNTSPEPFFPIKAFTLQWYKELFADSQIKESLRNSLIVATAVTFLSTSVATFVSFALVRHSFFGQGIFYAIALAPIVTPGVIIGVSLLIFFYRLNFLPGLKTVVLGQSSFIISFAMLTIMARLRKFDLALEEAAQDLGASKPRAMLKITLPFLKPAIISAAALSFLLSFDNFNTTLFLVGNKRTLPIQIFSMLRFGISPKINAISTILVVFTIIFGFFSRRIGVGREQSMQV